MSRTGARISFLPERQDGWLELLASGLTFDISGLIPAEPIIGPEAKYRFGLTEETTSGTFESVNLVPGQHLGGGMALQPVVRMMAGIAADLAIPLSAKAVCWNPAQIWMEPGYFARIALNWLSGGAFPALGLAAVDQSEDGSVISYGLSYFIGQEVQVEPLKGESPADTVKLAVRLIDYFVRYGPIEKPQQLEGPTGEKLLAEPAGSGGLVWIWRDA